MPASIIGALIMAGGEAAWVGVCIAIVSSVRPSSSPTSCPPLTQHRLRPRPRLSSARAHAAVPSSPDTAVDDGRRARASVRRVQPKRLPLTFFIMWPFTSRSSARWGSSCCATPSCSASPVATGP